MNVPLDRQNREQLDLAGLIEQMTAKLEARESVDLNSLLEEHPQHAEQIQSLLPAMTALMDLSTSAPRNEDLFASNMSNGAGDLRRLGDFHIGREIGRGGMGVVYEAEQVSLGRRVALKVLPFAAVLDKKCLQRFRNEARAAGALDHPNIVSVHSVGCEHAVHFYSMQLIEGQSLAEAIIQLRSARKNGDSNVSSGKEQPTATAGDTMSIGALSTHGSTGSRDFYRTVARLGIQVAEALQYAHEMGIVHRDIKPSNLLLDSSGSIWVADFGLAMIQTDADLTKTGDIVGTLRYMSPELAAGKRAIVDHLTDVYSLGVTLYELLTLRPAYVAGDRQQLLREIAFDEPTRLRRVDRHVPEELETIVYKAMSKDKTQRYSSAQELADDLRSHLENRPIKAKRPTRFEVIGKWTRRNLILTWAAIITLSVVSLTLAASTFFVLRELDRRTFAEQETNAAQETLWNERWARRHSLPEIRRLVDQEKFADALNLALEVEHQIPEDPTLKKMWSEFSVETSIATDPTGVDISFREWNAGRREWRHIGTTPIDRARLPKGHYHWKLTKNDHATLVLLRSMTQGEMKFKLERSDSLPTGMVRVTGGDTFISLSGISHVDRLPVGDFLIDRFEVTNRQFQDFVDRGGYSSRQYWKHPFVKNDLTLSWEDAMTQFVDSTGESGPAGWKSGRYPEGRHDYPVRGVSWYEAAAYAELAGKRLPSIYQWERAASIFWDAAYIIPISNFGIPVSNVERKMPAPAGRYLGVGGHGAFDMAGNVKEWCWNSAGAGKRYVLGGAWNEPKFMFTVPDVQPPFARSDTYGFRCVKILSLGETSPRIDEEIVRLQRDFSQEKPVSDSEFEICKRLYSYDAGPLNEKVLSRTEADGYSYEKIEFDAAYGDERVTAYFYRPSHVKPPYQTVIYFPPANTLYQEHFDETVLSWQIAFIVENGRAVLYPTYKGTFERQTKLSRSRPAATTLYRDHVVAWSKDLGRSIDYLQTRSDVEHEKLSYYGYSWGASLGAILLAVEKRIKVAVLSGAGLNEQETFPEVSQINFGLRVTIPVLMLNGLYNTSKPVELTVEPMFRLLGTPAVDKRLLTFESGRFIPQKDLTRETVSWLDKYLGPVELSAE